MRLDFEVEKWCQDILQEEMKRRGLPLEKTVQEIIKNTLSKEQAINTLKRYLG